MLHVEGQAWYLKGGGVTGCCRGRPSVYFEKSVCRTDWDKARLFNDKELGQDEEGEARQDA